MNEYADSLLLLEAALPELSLGQVVRDERYSMMELMSAIEINDSRTDTYLYARKQREAQQPPLPPFDPRSDLTAEEVLYMADELFRLDATFHDGHPLASTLWTCNYLRPDSLAAVSGFSAPPSYGGSEASAELPEQLRAIVLRSLLLGTIKCTEIAWEELRKGQVYEHEDVHLNTSSLTFPSLLASCFPPPPPPVRSPLALPGQAAEPPQERVVSVDDVLRALDEALKWLQDPSGAARGIEEAVREALVARLTMRIDLLYVFALLTSLQHTSPSQLTHHLGRLSSFSPLFPTAASPSNPTPPSLAVRAAFSPSTTVPLLSTQQPPRPVAPLPLGEAYDALLRRTTDELRSLVGLWDAWDAQNRAKQGGGWKDVREFCVAAGRRARTRSPYIRSISQTLISTPSFLFATHPPLTLSTAFLSTLCALPPTFLERLTFSRLRETCPTQPAHRALAWAERLAALFLVPTTTGIAGQNRGRQRRIIVKSCRAFGELVSEARDVAVPLLTELAPLVGAEEEDVRALERIPAAVAAHALELVLEALMCGFEEDVGLYASEEDRRSVWWVAERVAEKLEAVWEELLVGRGEMMGGEADYVRAKRDEAKALRAMCQASWKTSSLLIASTPPPKFSSPLLIDLTLSPAAAARGRFEQRFDWLDKLVFPLPLSPGVDGAKLASWTAYQATNETAPASLAEQALAAYRTALDALTALGSIPLAAKGASIRPEDPLRWLTALRRTAAANQNVLEAFIRDNAVPFAATAKWDHSWFPPYTADSR
ncbi:hypothetical protein JCM10207_001849 [Rhodosporidiobolus poonsookiae]